MIGRSMFFPMFNYFCTVLEMAVPAKVFYLDCQVMHHSEFLISWGWPLVSETEAPRGQSKQLNDNIQVVDKSIMHAVIEYKEDDQVKRTTVRTSPYIFNGMYYQIYPF